MTYGVLQVSAIALGLAALVSLSPVSTARADAPPPSGTTSATSGEASSPNGAASAPNAATAAQHRAHAYVRHYAHHTYGRHYHFYGHNPVAAAATGVVGGIADLGSIAAYPVYCFPNYGSCPVYLPY